MGYEALARPEGFAAMDSVEAGVRGRTHRGSDSRPRLGVPAASRAGRRSFSRREHAVPEHQRRRAARSGARCRSVVAPVEERRAAASSVVLEITEHERIRDYDVLARVLAAYRAEGIRFALDDVGEGHSTLELLAASASEFLKLGRSLTMTSTKVGSRAAMDATLAFARVSGAVVIAEGVENEFVADLMKAGGIRLGQGFGLGKPTMASDVEDVAAALAERAALSALRPRRRRSTPSTDQGTSVHRAVQGAAVASAHSRVRRELLTERGAGKHELRVDAVDHPGVLGGVRRAGAGLQLSAARGQRSGTEAARASLETVRELDHRGGVPGSPAQSAARRCASARP